MKTTQSANPFLKDKFETPFESIPFDQIQPSHFEEALRFYLNRFKQALLEFPQEITFENTIELLEEMNYFSDRIINHFNNIYITVSTPELASMAPTILTYQSQQFNEMVLHPELFTRIQTLYSETKTNSSWDKEQKELITKYYHKFVQNGAHLSSEKKEILRKLDEELSSLLPKFSNHLLEATKSFECVVETESDLTGLPPHLIQMAKSLAEKNGLKDKWVFNLQAPSLGPFMKYSKNRKLREKMWTAYNTRCFGGEYDNSQILTRILELRAERARLLGCENHAEYVLQDRMAKNPKQVFDFIDKLYTPSRQAALKDVEDLKQLSAFLDTEIKGEIQPWDFAYLSEQWKEKHFHYNDEMSRPYFPLEKVKQGLFHLAQKLFGLTFQRIYNIPTYHPEVETYEVFSEEPPQRHNPHNLNNAHNLKNNHIGLLYFDMHPRYEKQGGAWVTWYQNQYNYRKNFQRPHVGLICNFTRPQSSSESFSKESNLPSQTTTTSSLSSSSLSSPSSVELPALLTHQEVETFFHEFGHALHALFSECKYPSISGTQVLWDFVELPSQFFENWAIEEEVLPMISEHYQTHEKMPQDLIQKIIQSKRYQAGWNSLRQLSMAYLDMKLHTLPLEAIKDKDFSIAKMENQFLSSFRLIPVPTAVNISCSFSHIIDGGYSAGYYSYKWAEVIEADAFEYVKQNGIFNRDITFSFRDKILKKGASEPPMDLYIQFRGREPDPSALLKRDGLQVRVALVYRIASEASKKLAADLVPWLEARGHIVLTAPEQTSITGTKVIANSEEFSKVSLVIALGGDGTYLRAVRLLNGLPIPILGVNLGSLGFLTPTQTHEVYEHLEKALRSELKLIPRTLLKVEIFRNKNLRHSLLALNDMVLERGSLSQLIHINIQYEDKFVSEVKADGLILSSPTGSTAYNLAAGGPLLHPDVNAFVVTAVAPHSLTHRPLLLPDERTVTLKLVGKSQKAVLVVDGQKVCEISQEDQVIVQKHSKCHYFVRDPSIHFFHLLREKLKFGERL